MSPALILASESPRRRELLASMGWEFSVFRPDFSEITAAGDPEELPLLNALGKAGSVAGRFPGALVIGADTVIIDGGRIIGKPRDAGDAHAILMSLSGRAHRVVTGVALRWREGGVCRAFTVSTDVFFKAFDSRTAGDYLVRVQVLDKAGAYAIQEHGELLVERIAGSESNVVGLPVEALQRELEEIRCHA